VSAEQAERLPMPDWTRPGESWRIEAEPGWQLTRTGSCDAKGCFRPAVAIRPHNRYANCEVHLRTGLMWIENGQVVSWAQEPR
jgi:hypothetical protein